jgi:hypothetical protein
MLLVHRTATVPEKLPEDPQREKRLEIQINLINQDWSYGILCVAVELRMFYLLCS